ncbi:MAG: M20/M25/M40 family metallo-hydrolase, partial [bacterium]
VVAKLPGTALPERQILVSGHYDSRTVGRCDGAGFAPGANDDGSGTAGVLELARVLSQYEFEATLIFVAFTSEEQGLFGSRHYAQQARARGDNIIAMVTNDVIGNVIGGSGQVDSTSVRCFSDDPMDSPHRQLARYIKLQGEAYTPDFTVNLIPSRDRPGRGGDHFAFNEQGFTAARLTEPEDNLGHQHNPNDLPEFMAFSYLRTVVQVNASYLANLGWAPPAPTGFQVEESSATNYKLSWNPANGSESFNYLVSLRQANTTAFDSLLNVGAKTEITLSDLLTPVLMSVSAVKGEMNESLFTMEVMVD